ncbi:MAG: hypothetical protein FWG81_05405 [Betaproteobacteria bacterium]|nr:hypothetical protein [Betaproteobacteria bacterium]
MILIFKRSNRFGRAYFVIWHIQQDAAQATDAISQRWVGGEPGNFKGIRRVTGTYSPGN